MQTLTAYASEAQSFPEIYQGGNYSAYILVPLFAVIIGVALFFLLRKARAVYMSRLVYQCGFSEEGVHAGDTVTMTEVIANPSWFPLFGVSVGFFMDSGLEIDGVLADKGSTSGKRSSDKTTMFYFTSRFNLMPKCRVTRKHTVKCRRRGVYHLDTAEVFVNGDYIYLSSPTDFYVYPETLDVNGSVLPSACSIGEFDTKNRYVSDPFIMSGLRPYQHGDPFNTINFKASSRAFRNGSRELTVNSHDSSSQFNMMIYFDFEVPRSNGLLPEQTRELAEAGLKYAAAMVEAASSSGGRVGFASNSYLVDKRKYIHFPPDGSRNSMIEILKSLATVEAAEGSSFTALLDRDMNTLLFDTDVCIITFGMSDELSGRINLLRQYNKSVSILLLDK